MKVVPWAKKRDYEREVIFIIVARGIKAYRYITE
jgi:hypothetical protein